MKTLSLEANYKIELLADWGTELGLDLLPPRWSFGPFLSDWVKVLKLESGVILERTSEDILIRPYAAQTWDEIYAEKLKMGNPSALDLSEVSGDDLIL